MFRGLWADLVYSKRRIVGQPGLSSAIVLTFALGLGTNTAIFSVAHTILLESLPVRAPRELVLLQWTSGPDPDVAYLTGEFAREPGTGRVSAASFPYPAFARFTQASDTLTDLLASGRLADVIVSAGGHGDLADVELVSGSYFGALGVRAVLGRVIAPADDRAGSTQVAMLSHEYWQRRFGRDSGVVGTTITIQATPFTIVGVAPAGFRGTMQLGSSFDVAVPLSAVTALAPDRPYLSHPKWYWLQVMGRLKPTASQAQARNELNALMRESGDSAPDRPQIALVPGHQGLQRARDEQRMPVRLLTAIAGFVLLLSCASVAALLVSRAEARTREFSVRKALGATRWQIMRQPLAEGVAYALLGAGAGFLLAHWTKHLVIAGLMPGSDIAVEFDAAVTFFLVSIALATGIVSGLIPGLRAARSRSREVTIGIVQTSPRRAVGGVLLIVQVSVAVVLAIGATLLVKSFLNLGRSDVGFAPESVQLFKVQFPADTAKEQGLSRRVQQRLRRLPGVRAVGISAHHQIDDRTDRWRISLPGNASSAAVASQTYVNRVGGDFFAAMGIPLRWGRLPAPDEARDGALPVVINEAFARTFLRDREPLGTSVDGHVIVGVVADTKYGSVRDPAPPTMFVPFSGDPGRSISVQLQTDAPAATLAPLIRQAVEEVASGAAVYGLMTGEEQIESALQRERFLARTTTMFGGLALLVATLAVFGSTASAVNLRTRELAIRMALGARPRAVLMLVTRDAAALAITGAALGALVASVLTPFVRTLLYGVEPVDPVAFAGTALVVIISAMTGCVLAARHALRVEPAGALRTE